jgi:O-antigen ligase
LGLHEAFLGSLGRDTSLTTRTDMWPALLSMQDQPLLGAGFNTFWTGRRLLQVEQLIGNMVIQAHNGYLDTYLNGGLVGLGLLIGLLCVSYRRIRQRLALGSFDARIRFAMLFVAIVHNNAEATFFKLSLLWFVTMYTLLDFRGPDRSGGRERQEEPRMVENVA